MHSPKFIEKPNVLSIHTKQIKRYGGSFGIRDEGLLDSAIYQPQASFGGELLHPTIVEQAAAYLFHITNNHAFVDGNKRTAFDVMVTFLNLNDYELDMTTEQAYELTIQVADNKVDKEKLIEILKTSIIELF
ncbi:type II toxin-antitoxin system death-on-curing family toxin [Nodularia spumigena CS-591/12]|uniref:Death-on-curing protein n=1 Tax=Nodularia spumigena CENA596 TaxID=1819295 RepID=A0A161VMK6_NODSP|nr:MULTISPECIES: type II toxin-antitoxin system death-on-curing family toxin [Cyanophyceae]KZL48035.1 death-on-curing protein [Nodularia spumigena CENA596]MDB9305282.1 type II toxin-antitoxin system death-on-curing family toxin [Nodularia spumigena CS-591/12]MDB9322088.1 type II toxin-antitoxin system death-on-curing family toxin [Nodularia spumigena CS-591/07A]MDB9330548.1 type II toxin-antitoxin system death-on-curing family toxin [Nodularia spumigena CS-591/04]MDB9361407.1 type II toxin-ant